MSASHHPIRPDGAAGRHRPPRLAADAAGTSPAPAASARRMPGAPPYTAVLGGTGAVSDAVLAQLDAQTAGDVFRIAGGDRFATAAGVSACAFDPGCAGRLHRHRRQLPRRARRRPRRGPAGRADPAGHRRRGPAGHRDRAATPATRPHRHPGWHGRDQRAGRHRARRRSPSDRWTGLRAQTGTRPPPRCPRRTSQSGVDAAFVATGQAFPDALAGVPAAIVMGGPIVLTAPDVLPEATALELARLQPQQIIVLGGTSAVSDAVATQLGTYTDGTVDRVAGPSRAATAAAIATLGVRRRPGRGVPGDLRQLPRRAGRRPRRRARGRTDPARQRRLAAAGDRRAARRRPTTAVRDSCPGTGVGATIPRRASACPRPLPT
jgi:hypothetical protein